MIRIQSVRRVAVVLLAGMFSWHAGASDSITTEPDEGSYHYVSHYAVEIDAPAAAVWRHVTDLGSWMHEFEMAHVSGTPGARGEVLRLYPGQDFFVQVIESIPNELLMIANLPSTFEGEHSTGIGVITLNEAGGATTVTLTMSRRYTWQGEGENPLKRQRASEEFSAGTASMWRGRFLGRLRDLAEGTVSSTASADQSEK